MLGEGLESFMLLGKEREGAGAGDVVRMVVVSDVHGDMDKVHGVVAEVEAEVGGAVDGGAVDLVCVLGDIADVKEPGDAGPGETASAEATISAILGVLHTLSDRVVYLPGNHDPASLFPYSTPVAEEPSPLTTPAPVPRLNDAGRPHEALRVTSAIGNIPCCDAGCAGS